MRRDVLQTELVQSAVEKDTAQQYEAATELYCQALAYFIPAIHCQSITVLNEI